MYEWSKKHQVLRLIAIEIILMVVMGLFTSYGPEAVPQTSRSSVKGNGVSTSTPKSNILQKDTSVHLYAMYQDVHVMIWVGFGFLMTFLKRYGYSAVGLTFLVGAILVQVAILFDGVANIDKNGKVPLSLTGLLNADVAVAAPLISMGAVLGKTTYMQLIVMGIIELAIFSVNKYIGEHIFMAIDAGGSMFVHVFGAYFGLAVSFAFGVKEKPKEHHLEGSNYQSDIFAMIGTIFLWLFWPSFNSALLQGDDQQRAIINTLLAITASCVVAFATSALVSDEHKFNMVHVQNSTLAGGVAIGTAAGMMCEPILALIVGGFAGSLSVFGYKYLTPLIQKKLRIHDTCGVHNLHGMPGVVAGIFGVLMAAIASEDKYSDSLYQIFPARAPSGGERLIELKELGIDAGFDRTAGHQAAYQLLALIITFIAAIVSGVITGVILRLDICGTVPEVNKFNDAFIWELEDEAQENNSRVVEQVPMSHI
ncbi:GSCOCG00000897001-RA-CDS [Cotesia congregata]|uniref:Similar to rhbg: Ammonium transporter Rh type B (Danio rerio) n=1 Tax=Cotesia congregata TaxID=51543 RepID=A0A8J2HDW9_COTCN|nr:GSCOCG00000897001-RA-CDS [Cotesia congregata]CAG5095726.1 Similar to rhbg: Ammonium transporter Rh type B (Danio rerio) [Cotesia congregata]